MKKAIYSTTLLLAFAGTAFAAEPGTAKPADAQSSASRVAVQPSPDAWKSDKQFVHDAAEAGNAEVAMGQLAAKKASNAQVKSFAQRMIDDHTKAGQELKQVAGKKNLNVSNGHGKHHQTMNRLAQLSGAEFDREYMKSQLTDHGNVIALFEAEADRGTDAEVKAWAAKTLPTLREHARMARDIAAAVGAANK
jgi:putative membrane protein